MSGPSKIKGAPIASKGELIAWFESGSTPAAKRLIGVEHEKPPFYLADNAPVPFSGEGGRRGVADFINAMVARGWDAGQVEHGRVIDIRKNNVSWTFEPGLQMETGGAPLKTVHQNARETDRTINEALEVCGDLGIGLLAMGYHPTHNAAELPFMPKSRYEMFRDYIRANKYPNMPEIMSCTSTVQVNLGYQDEADMVKMLRVSLALQPVATALFACSPFAQGKTTGYESYRSHKIYNSLGGRYGFMLPIAFDEGFGFEMFVDFALNKMPLLGVYQGNTFVAAGGKPFQDFIDGKLDICPGQHAALADWQNHLNTVWSEVRLRRFLEMRGADNGPAEMIKALPAFWVGLLYDRQALDDAYEMIRDWTAEDREYLRIMAPQQGLQTPFMGTTVQDIAKNALTISQAGLQRRGALDRAGNDESVYLEPLHEIAQSGLNWAKRLERRLQTEWNGDVTRVFNAMSYENAPSVLQAQPAARTASKPRARRDFNG